MKYKVGQIIRVEPKGVCKDNFIGEITHINDSGDLITYKVLFGQVNDLIEDNQFTPSFPWAKGVSIIASSVHNVDLETLKLLYER